MVGMNSMVKRSLGSADPSLLRSRCGSHRPPNSPHSTILEGFDYFFRGHDDEVRGVAFLRCLRAEADRDRVRKVFQQMLAVGKQAAQIAWEVLKQPIGTGS